MVSLSSGAVCNGGRRVPAVTIFGWDDVLCPTTHAKMERNKVASIGIPVTKSKEHRKEVCGSAVRCETGSRYNSTILYLCITPTLIRSNRYYDNREDRTFSKRSLHSFDLPYLCLAPSSKKLVRCQGLNLLSSLTSCSQSVCNTTTPLIGAKTTALCTRRLHHAPSCCCVPPDDLRLTTSQSPLLTIVPRVSCKFERWLDVESG